MKTDSSKENSLSMTDESFLKFWAAIMDKRESIKQQLADSEKKLSHQMTENNRQIEESEKKFLQTEEEKTRRITETGHEQESEFWKKFFSFWNSLGK